MVDIEKAQREQTRWIILNTTHISGAAGTSEGTIATVLTNLKLWRGPDHLRRELDYLEQRELITIEGRTMAPQWGVKLTRHGYDVAEYTVECEPGIGRPPKYWQGQ